MGEHCPTVAPNSDNNCLSVGKKCGQGLVIGMGVADVSSPSYAALDDGSMMPQESNSYNNCLLPYSKKQHQNQGLRSQLMFRARVTLQTLIDLAQPF